MDTLIKNCGGYDTSGTPLGYVTRNKQQVALYELSEGVKTRLRDLARFWVAHYAAYPVMWSLGQEVDDDFFADSSSGHNAQGWGKENNPYKLLAQYIAEFDPYHHPLTAHQETGLTASESAFRDVSAHTWYAVQWKPSSYATAISTTLPQSYWNSTGQGKPTVLYESRYCYQDTKEFGARLQGWMAFLNGMYGYGWGGNGSWRYGSTYGTDASSSDGVVTVTAYEKEHYSTWASAMDYASAYQVGYMRNFFENTVGDWYNLIPRFNSSTYYTAGLYGTSQYMLASQNDGNGKIDKAVVYFYNKGGSTGGTLKNLTSGATYHYRWFDPKNGTLTDAGTFTANGGTWTIDRISIVDDFVLYVYK